MDEVQALKTEWLALLDKWGTYKRNGSMPESAERIKDRERTAQIAARLDEIAPRV